MPFTVESIAVLLMEDSPRGMHAVGRALHALYRNDSSFIQAPEEHELRDDGRGFSKVDKEIGFSHAEFYMRAGFLTEKQVTMWRRLDTRGKPRIQKYTNQLYLIALEKVALKEGVNPPTDDE